MLVTALQIAALFIIPLVALFSAMMALRAARKSARAVDELKLLSLTLDDEELSDEVRRMRDYMAAMSALRSAKRDDQVGPRLPRSVSSRDGRLVEHH